jgi:hypothetical protein
MIPLPDLGEGRVKVLLLIGEEDGSEGVVLF